MMAPAPAPRPVLAVAVVAALLPPLAAVVTTLRLGGRGYAAIHSDYPGLLTALASTLGRSVLAPAALLCVGALVTAVLLRPRRGPDRLLVERFGAMDIARAAALVWAVAAAVLVLVDAADVNGQSLGAFAHPRSLALVSAGYLPRAWVVVLVCVGGVLLTTMMSRSWPSHAVLLGVVSLAVLAPVMVEHVLIGPNHDFAGDATIFAAPVAVAWFGSTAVLFLFWDRLRPTAGLMRRYALLAAIAWPVVTAGQLVVALVETEGTAFPASSTGQLFCVQFAVLAALGVLGVRRWNRGLRSGFDPGRSRRLLGVGTLLAAGYLAAELAMLRIPSPNYFQPSSVAQNFLGYDVREPLSVLALALHWRLNLLFVVLAAIGVGVYLAGVRRLVRRGDRWPVGRSISWVAGWALVVLTTSSGVGRYAGASFSVHMALHMSLNMFVPALLVLGGPITLLLRASPARPEGRPAGPHEWSTALTNWRLSRSFAHPLHAFVSYTTSYYLLYFSDLFNQANRYHWAHEVMNLEFLAIGYLFFGLIVGMDAPPRPLPHIAKLGLVLAAMPFHAFFGVVVMTSNGIIARDFYSDLASAAPWITDLRHDQYVGGGIAWAAGEFPLTFVLIALLLQWSRQDAREATRLDRHLDAGLDDSYDAYNAMLARLAARSGDGPAAAGENPRATPVVPDHKSAGGS